MILTVTGNFLLSHLRLEISTNEHILNPVYYAQKPKIFIQTKASLPTPESGSRLMPKNQTDPLLNELTAIKKLLILKLLSEGFTQSQIATVLGVDQSYISRMVPSRVIKANRK